MRSDEELLEDWRAGTPAAGAELVERHFSSVFRFFRSKVDKEASDLAQQTFTACVEQRDRIPEGVGFRAYLMGIAYKQMLMFLRRKGRERKKHDDFARRSVEELTGTPSQIIAARQEQTLLLRALRRIPLEMQVLIEMHYWEGIGMKGIAEVLDIPPGTVKSRLHRARATLRKQVVEVADSPELAKSTVDNLDKWAGELRDLLPASK